MTKSSSLKRNFQIKSMSKRGTKDSIKGAGRKMRRSPQPAVAVTHPLPASDSESTQPHAERKEGYELNDKRARWDSGKQVGHKI
jgi:hypothetical protein